MTEHPADIGLTTHTGMRFAAIWLKRRAEWCGKFSNGKGGYGVKYCLPESCGRENKYVSVFGRPTLRFIEFSRVHDVHLSAGLE